jgi:glycosyltransferase involved in cell wall biosynthesis
MQSKPVIVEPLLSQPATFEGVSIVIPAFNEEQGIGAVLEQLFGTLDQYKDQFEIIVVDDGSTDKTAEIVSGFPVRLISHGINKGYGASLKTGVRAASHDLVVMMDSDGQHDPCDIIRLVELSTDHDMVVGARTRHSHAPLLRRPGKWLLQKTANFLAGRKIPDLNSGFRAFRRDLILRFAHILPNGFSFTTTLTLAALKENYKVAWTPITVTKRAGTSSVNPLNDGVNTFILILRTVVLFDPLKVFLPPSLFLGVFGSAFSIYGLIQFKSFPDTGVVVLTAAIVIFFMGILADSISSLRLGMRS